VHYVQKVKVVYMDQLLSAPGTSPIAFNSWTTVPALADWNAFVLDPHPPPALRSCSGVVSKKGSCLTPDLAGEVMGSSLAGSFTLPSACALASSFGSLSDFETYVETDFETSELDW
jgi:hypothetical protein